MNITNNAAASRYELALEGHICVADYHLQDGKLIINHVGVPPELRNRGLAAELMKYVVDDAKARGLIIVPVCSYAASYLKRNPV